MPDNKLQHYVPKCHLRPFSVVEGRTSINVYNIDSDKCISDAPIKGQCARSYFYGKDLGLEHALQGPEGLYAAIVKRAEDDAANIKKPDLEALRDFTLLQTYRTYAYVEKLMMLSEKMHEDLLAAAGGKPVPGPAIKSVGEAVAMALQHFVHGLKHIADLDMCLVVNKAQREFITSDDPAILTNRFHLQKLKTDAFGLVSSGTIFVLPLTPRLAFMAYDANVYHIPERQGPLITITENREVLALNALQYLHARKNLYYADPASGKLIADEFKNHAHARHAVWVQFQYFEKKVKRPEWRCSSGCRKCRSLAAENS